jgi:hypothetical protein
MALGAISFAIFSKPEYKAFAIYFYWRVILLAGVCGNIFHLVYGVIVGQTGLDYGHYIVQVYVAQIFPYCNLTILFFRLVMDLVVVLDRIALFAPRLKEIVFRFSPMVNSLGVLVFVAYVNGPMADFYEVYRWNLLTPDGQSSAFYNTSASSFSKTLFGQILFNFIFVVRHLVTLFLEIALNIVSVIVFHIIKKGTLVSRPANKCRSGHGRHQSTLN